MSNAQRRTSNAEVDDFDIGHSALAFITSSLNNLFAKQSANRQRAIANSHHSFRSEFTGLARAALSACVDTIIRAKVNAIKPVRGNTHHGIPTRYL
jgi:hypothetical protein